VRGLPNAALRAGKAPTRAGRVGRGHFNFAFQSVGDFEVWDPPHIAKTAKLLKCGVYYRDVYDAHTLFRARSATDRFPVSSPLTMAAPNAWPKTLRSEASSRWLIVNDFTCDMCNGPAGLMVQGRAFAFRCSKCDSPGAGSLIEFVADRLQSNYKAVLLSRSSEELSVVAQGIGSEIVPLVLAAAADGQFVWMKPQ